MKLVCICESRKRKCTRDHNNKISHKSTSSEAFPASGLLLYDNQHPYLLSKLYFLFLAGENILIDTPTCVFFFSGYMLLLLEKEKCKNGISQFAAIIK